MSDHLEKESLVSSDASSGKDEPKEAEKRLSEKEIMKYFEKGIKTLPEDIYDRVVNILGESVFDLQKEGVMAKLEESATDILKSKKGETK